MFLLKVTLVRRGAWENKFTSTTEALFWTHSDLLPVGLPSTLSTRSTLIDVLHSVLEYIQGNEIRASLKNGVFWVVPPKRRFLQEPHGVTIQKTPFLIVTAVKTSNLTRASLNHTQRPPSKLPPVHQ
jgi:hypothetical protein